MYAPQSAAKRSLSTVPHLPARSSCRAGGAARSPSPQPLQTASQLISMPPDQWQVRGRDRHAVDTVVERLRQRSTTESTACQGLLNAQRPHQPTSTSTCYAVLVGLVDEAAGAHVRGLAQDCLRCACREGVHRLDQVEWWRAELRARVGAGEEHCHCYSMCFIALF